MKRSLSIKLKAIFLLVVFSLSTLVSFACAAGLDMGYNRGHHTIQDYSISEEHPNKSRTGSRKAKHGHSSDSPKEHDHNAAIDHHDKKNGTSKESAPDDCCRDEAAKFEKCDKLNPQPFNYNLQAVFITLIIDTVFNVDAITASLHNPNLTYLVRNHHPPIADTRIAIQSFLI